MVDIQEYKKNLERKTCSVKEFSKMLGISYEKALRLTRIEGAPILKIGRDKRIVLSKVDDFLNEHIGECL